MTKPKSAYRKLFKWDRPSSIQPVLLKIIPWEGANLETKLESDEYVSVCPYSGLPDFAHLSIEYEPHTAVLEQKSFKLYIVSYHRVGILQEEAAEKIFNDVWEVLHPVYLSLEMVFNARGGFKNTITKVRYGE